MEVKYLSLRMSWEDLYNNISSFWAAAQGPQRPLKTMDNILRIKKKNNLFLFMKRNLLMFSQIDIRYYLKDFFNAAND